MAQKTRSPSRSPSRLVDVVSILAAVGLALAACETLGTRSFGPGEIAAVDDVVLTDSDLRYRFWKGTMDERRKALQKGGRMFLTDLVIADALLRREAQRREINPRFTDMYEYHDGLMKRFLNKELHQKVRLSDVTDAELRAEYTRLRPKLIEPDRRTIQVLATKTHDEAEEFLTKVAAARVDKNAGELDRLFLERERDHPGTRKGDWSIEEATSRLGDAIAQAGFEVDIDVGYHPEPVEYLEGFAVVVVIGELEPPRVPRLDEIEDQIRRRVYAHRRDEALDEFVASFRSKHTVVINESTMSLVPWVIELPEDAPSPNAGPTGPDKLPPPPVQLPPTDDAPPQAPSPSPESVPEPERAGPADAGR